MSVYVISYSLKNKEHDYRGLFDAIKGIGSWMHFLDSNWLISTDKNKDDVFNILTPHIEDSDYILIIEATGSTIGTIPTKGWDWLKEHYKD